MAKDAFSKIKMWLLLAKNLSLADLLKITLAAVLACLVSAAWKAQDTLLTQLMGSTTAQLCILTGVIILLVFFAFYSMLVKNEERLVLKFEVELDAAKQIFDTKIKSLEVRNEDLMIVLEECRAERRSIRETLQVVMTKLRIEHLIPPETAA